MVARTVHVGRLDVAHSNTSARDLRSSEVGDSETIITSKAIPRRLDQDVRVVMWGRLADDESTELSERAREVRQKLEDAFYPAARPLERGVVVAPLFSSVLSHSYSRKHRRQQNQQRWP